MAYKINIPVFVTDTPSGPVVSYGAATDNCPPSGSGKPQVKYPRPGDVAMAIGPWSKKGKLTITYDLDPQSGYVFFGGKLDQTDNRGGDDPKGEINFDTRVNVFNRKKLVLTTKDSTWGAWNLSFTLKNSNGNLFGFDPEITNTDEVKIVRTRARRTSPKTKLCPLAALTTRKKK